jgi:hypothetical protein
METFAPGMEMPSLSVTLPVRITCAFTIPARVNRIIMQVIVFMADWIYHFADIKVVG